jgi:hypothetical protein
MIHGSARMLVSQRIAGSPLRRVGSMRPTLEGAARRRIAPRSGPDSRLLVLEADAASALRGMRQAHTAESVQRGYDCLGDGSRLGELAVAAGIPAVHIDDPGAGLGAEFEARRRGAVADAADRLGRGAAVFPE